MPWKDQGRRISWASKSCLREDVEQAIGLLASYMRNLSRTEEIDETDMCFIDTWLIQTLINRCA